jgi:hypothetical protein
MADADYEVIRRHLPRLLSSEQLEKSETSQKLLRYLAERALRGETPKETEIAIDVFGRDASFNSAEESRVRVGIRALRGRLRDYYEEAGQNDEFQFVIPKGGYRLNCVAREAAPEPDEAVTRETEVAGALAAAEAEGAIAEPPSVRTSHRWLWMWSITASALLLASLSTNVYLWLGRTKPSLEPEAAALAHTPFWTGIIDSDRPIMLVLGDGFMYTNVDPLTGRVQYIRDRAINSSEELRIFLAANPSIAQGRGQRYTSMLQKSTTLGMVNVLRLVSHPGRQVEVRLRDDLQVEDFQKYDIVYIGPLSRLGLLAGHYELQSRYRYESKTASVRDVVTGKSFVPEGEVTDKHTEYALAARFIGPGGHRILLLTPGGRNSGMLLTVRAFTSTEKLQDIGRRLLAFHTPQPDSFEALLSVTSFGQTDVAAEILDVHPLPNTEDGAAATPAGSSGG